MVWDHEVAGSNPAIPTENLSMERIDFGVTYGYGEFIDKETQNHLLDWVQQNRELLNQSDGNKITGVLEKIETSPTEIIEMIRKKIVEMEGLHKFVDPMKSRTFLSVYGKNSKCDVHSDTSPNENFVHVRYNLMLSKPNKGGETIYDGHFLDIEERVLWRCVAEYSKHGSDEVLSNKPRTIISFGFLIDKEEFERVSLAQR